MAAGESKYGMPMLGRSGAQIEELKTSRGNSHVKKSWPEIERDARDVEVRALAVAAGCGFPLLTAFGKQSDRVFLIYERVEGHTVKEHSGAVSLECWDKAAHGLLVAAHALHLNSLVHYDISESNVLIRNSDKDASITLIDVGHADKPGLTSRGSPGYMAPEMLQGLQGDSRSDMFSIGVVLSQLALGRRVFTAETGRAFLSTLRSRLTNVVSGLEKAIGELRATAISRLLSPNIQDRAGDALEVLDNLVRIDGFNVTLDEYSRSVEKLVRLDLVTAMRKSGRLECEIKRHLGPLFGGATSKILLECATSIDQGAAEILIVEEALSAQVENLSIGEQENVGFSQDAVRIVRSGPKYVTDAPDSLSEDGAHNSHNIMIRMEEEEHSEQRVLALPKMSDGIESLLNALKFSSIDVDRLKWILRTMLNGSYASIAGAIGELAKGQKLRRINGAWIGLGADSEWVRIIAAARSSVLHDGQLSLDSTGELLVTGARLLFHLDSGGYIEAIASGTSPVSACDFIESIQAYLSCDPADRLKAHYTAASLAFPEDKLEAAYHGLRGDRDLIVSIDEVFESAVREGHVLRGRLLLDGMKEYRHKDLIEHRGLAAEWLAIELGEEFIDHDSRRDSRDQEGTYLRFCGTSAGALGEIDPEDVKLLPAFARLAIELDTACGDSIRVLCDRLDVELGAASFIEKGGQSRDSIVQSSTKDSILELKYWRKRSILHCLGAAGRLCWLDGLLKRGREYFEIGKRVAAAMGLEMWVSKFVVNLGNCLVGGESDAEAIRVLDEAISRKLKLGDYEGAARAYGNAGISHHNRGRTRAAIDAWQRQEALIRAGGSGAELAQVLTRLSVGYQSLGDWLKAGDLLRNARAISQSYDDEDALLLVDINDIEMRITRGELGLAESLCNTVLGRSRSLPARRRDKLIQLAARTGLERGDWKTVARYLRGTACDRIDGISKLAACDDQRDMIGSYGVALGLPRRFFVQCKECSQHEAMEPLSEEALMLSFGKVLAGNESNLELVSAARELLRKGQSSGAVRSWQMLGNIALQLDIVCNQYSSVFVREFASVSESLEIPGIAWRSSLLLANKALRADDFVSCAIECLFALETIGKCFNGGMPEELSLEQQVPQFVLVWLSRIRERMQKSSLESRPLGDQRCDSLSSFHSDIIHFLRDANLACGSGGGVWRKGIRRVLAVSQQLTTDADTGKLLDQIVSSLLEVCDGENAFVVLYDEKGRLSVSLAKSALERGSSVVREEVSSTIIGRVARNRRALLIKNVLDDESLLFSQSVKNLDLHAAMCAPLLHRGDLLGAVYVDNRSATGVFDEEDLQVLEVFANQAAVAIQNRKMIGDLKRLYEDLAQAHQRIVKSEKLKVLGEMASGVAHDFNNLLTSILVRSQMLADAVDSEFVQLELGHIEKAALDGANVIRRIQEYTRSRREGDFEVFSLSSAVSGAISFVEPRLRVAAGHEGVQIVVVEFDDVQLYGNSSEIREVLTNLLINAADSMAGVGEIRVGVRRVGRDIVLSVSDHGAGISDEVVSKIFDPFFSTKGEGGNGLGLSVAHGIVARHGGSISVETELGIGSSFNVRLPVRGPDEVVLGPRALDGGLPVGYRVLLVDDDEGVRSGVCRGLRELGLDVEEAESAEGALQALEKGDFDVVVSDYNIPGMTGLELYSEINRLGLHSRFVLISGSMNHGERESAKRAGVGEVLAKPFRCKELLDLVVAKHKHGR